MCGTSNLSLFCANLLILQIFYVAFLCLLLIFVKKTLELENNVFLKRMTNFNFVFPQYLVFYFCFVLCIFYQIFLWVSLISDMDPAGPGQEIYDTVMPQNKKPWFKQRWSLRIYPWYCDQVNLNWLYCICWGWKVG